jgi:hypothetical protein
VPTLTNAVTYASVGKTKFVPDSLMYMPYPQIAGCRPYWETDNRDCRATVVIPISSLPTHEAVAEFYAHLAYPEPVDATQRQKYCIALSRWAVLERSNIDKTWEKSQQNIRPLIFSQSERLYSNTRRLGTLILWRRMELARTMLLPHLENQLRGEPFTVRKITEVIGDVLGYEEGSHKTIEAKIWRPVKPVAHAAAAASLSLTILRDPRQGWDEQRRLCAQQPFLATFFYEDVFTNVVLWMAEIMRLQLPSCERFKISAADTVRFAADWMIQLEETKRRQIQAVDETGYKFE